MRLLRDSALFSDSEHVRRKAVRTLVSLGQNAIPVIVEIADAVSESSFKRFCLETIERIECRRY